MFRFGSKVDDLSVTESRPLYPSLRTNAEADPDVRQGPVTDVKALSREVLI